MRSSIMLIAFISGPAWACPKLEGTYKICKSNNIESATLNEMVIEQKIVNKFSQYTFSTKEAGPEDARIEKYLADGIVKITTETDADTGTSLKTSTSTWCTGEVLNIKVRAQVDSQDLANLTIETTKSGTQLTQKLTGTSMGEPVNEIIICE